MYIRTNERKSWSTTDSMYHIRLMLIIGNSLNLVYFRGKEINKVSVIQRLSYLLDLSMHEK